MTCDITFERDPLDRADPPADWGDEIPVNGSVLPERARQRIARAVGGEWADWPLEAVGGYLLDDLTMDQALEALDFVAVQRANGNKLDEALAAVPAWELEPEYHYFEDIVEEIV